MFDVMMWGELVDRMDEVSIVEFDSEAPDVKRMEYELVPVMGKSNWFDISYIKSLMSALASWLL
jgi:hypothetical protein